MPDAEDPDVDEDEAADEPSNTDAKPNAKPAGGEDESWRCVSVETLGLPATLARRLVDQGVSTIGHIADWTKSRPLTDLEGVGEKKAELIEDAFGDFWRKHLAEQL